MMPQCQGHSGQVPCRENATTMFAVTYEPATPAVVRIFCDMHATAERMLKWNRHWQGSILEVPIAMPATKETT